MENKMTDNEIIEAFECCNSLGTHDGCLPCPFYDNKGLCMAVARRINLEAEILDLINRQKAEIERLQKYNSNMGFKHYNDGIFDFAEILKGHRNGNFIFITTELLNRIVKARTRKE